MKLITQTQIVGKDIRKRRPAFTLMEMLVVVAIIVVLAFNMRHQRLPMSLEEMCDFAPDGGRPTLDVKALIDPWGNQYVYNLNYIGINGAPQIYSIGPPGQNLPIMNFN